MALERLVTRDQQDDVDIYLGEILRDFGERAAGLAMELYHQGREHGAELARPAGHEHAWKALAARVITTRVIVVGDVDRTVVLQKCECGEVKVTSLDGAWTLEQIRDDG